MAIPVVPLRWRGGGVRRWASKLLLLDRTRPSQEATSAAEGAVLLTASGTAHALSVRKVRGLRAASQKLVAAAGAVVAAAAALAAFQALHTQTVTARQRDADTRLTAAFGRGPRSLTMSARTMTVLEVLVISIEMSFWYMVGAESLNSSAPLAARIPAALVAVFVPLAGVLTARLSGLLLGRYLGATGRRALREIVLLAVSLTLLVVAAGGTFYLVDWRYSGSAALGAREIPGSAMGLLFAIVLVVIALLHAAVVDHEGHEDRVRIGELAGLATQQSAMEIAVIRARHNQAAVALALCELIDSALDEMERILLTGQEMVLAARAVRGVDPQTVTFADRAGQQHAALKAPWAVDLRGPSVLVHALVRAVHLLEKYEPDIDGDRLAAGVRARLYELFGRTPQEASTVEASTVEASTDKASTDKQLPTENVGPVGEADVAAHTPAGDVEFREASADILPGPVHLSVVHDQPSLAGPRDVADTQPDMDVEPDILEADGDSQV